MTQYAIIAKKGTWEINRQEDKLVARVDNASSTTEALEVFLYWSGVSTRHPSEYKAVPVSALTTTQKEWISLFILDEDVFDSELSK